MKWLIPSLVFAILLCQFAPVARSQPTAQDRIRHLTQSRELTKQKLDQVKQELSALGLQKSEALDRFRQNIKELEENAANRNWTMDELTQALGANLAMMITIYKPKDQVADQVLDTFLLTPDTGRGDSVEEELRTIISQRVLAGLDPNPETDAKFREQINRYKSRTLLYTAIAASNILRGNADFPAYGELIHQKQLEKQRLEAELLQNDRQLRQAQNDRIRRNFAVGGPFPVGDTPFGPFAAFFQLLAETERKSPPDFALTGGLDPEAREAMILQWKRAGGTNISFDLETKPRVDISATKVTITGGAFRMKQTFQPKNVTKPHVFDHRLAPSLEAFSGEALTEQKAFQGTGSVDYSIAIYSPMTGPKGNPIRGHVTNVQWQLRADPDGQTWWLTVAIPPQKTGVLSWEKAEFKYRLTTVGP